MTVTREELATLSFIVYHDLKYPQINLNYEIIDKQHFGSGLYVETYKKETGEIIIVTRGTDLSTIESTVKDLKADFGIGLNQVPSTYEDYKNYVNSIRDMYQGTSIILTGHSLGGAYPQLYNADCALNYNTEQRTQLRAVTFGAPSVYGVVIKNWYKKVKEYGGMGQLSSSLSIENCIRKSDPIPILTWSAYITNEPVWEILANLDGKTSDLEKISNWEKFYLGKTTLFPAEGLNLLDAHSAYNYLLTAWAVGSENAIKTNEISKVSLGEILENINILTLNLVDNSIKNNINFNGKGYTHLLAPNDPSFIDATLELNDINNGYSLEYNDLGVKWRVTSYGQVHQDDLLKYQKQNKYYEQLIYDNKIFNDLTLDKYF